ncbi:MAG: hypothetical protein ACJ8C4_19095 [Gemmataceae bacterium]
MSEVRLVIREADRDWSGTIHGGSADRAIAGLSADPTTLAELEVATARFAKTSRPFFGTFSRGLIDEPYDSGFVLIDLIARIVVMDSTYSSLERSGGVCYHDGHHETDIVLPYHLADDWLLMNDRFVWQAIAAQRRRENVKPILDVRSVFYGSSMMEFMARRTFAQFSTLGSAADSHDVQNALKEIHAEWLLTPREDLGGRCPREVALDRKGHINWDLQDQSERWSLLKKCPPGLDLSSRAFRYGGFGTHELVHYYYLVRELLWSCWEQLIQDYTHSELLTVGDFLTQEVPRLEVVSQEWLNTPQPENHGRTPRSMIDRERARLPEGISGRAAMVDPDCPCCQMLADMPGPAFWHLDGCNMEDEFAFDLHHRTRDEWESEQREWEEHRRRFNAERAECERLGVTDPRAENSVWSSSFATADGPEVPLGIRLFGIGCRLAELMTDIRGWTAELAGPATQRVIDQLNRDFGNMREVLQTLERSISEALINPVIERFVDCLAAVREAYPNSAEKCNSLTITLENFLNPTLSENAWGSSGEDIPF